MWVKEVRFMVECVGFVFVDYMNKVDFIVNDDFLVLGLVFYDKVNVRRGVRFGVFVGLVVVILLVFGM